MERRISVTIETSCRIGGVALGVGENLVQSMAFDAAGRHATQLISRLRDLLAGAGSGPSDVAELYVSVGPGSFTGLRVGITAARTLAQSVPDLRLVAVPTAHAVADNARNLDWRNLGVIMDARDGGFYAALFTREDDTIVSAGPARTLPAADFLADAPRPLLLVGEGLSHQDVSDEGVTAVAPERTEIHLPTPEGVWRVGRRLADAGDFTDYHLLLPLYARQPEAVRLWETRSRP